MSAGDVQQAELRVGRVLRRRWTLERVIGIGGTAAVYAATHRNGSRVAIKVLHPSLQAEALILQRFLREGYLANKIGVPDVVKVLDDDVEGDCAYLVMELLEGATMEVLRERAGGRLAPLDVLAIGCRLLGVLEAAHARGVLHRDIKPANLFRTLDPVSFKVLDFGIAKILDPRRPVGDTAVGRDGIVGTPAFMAPEQARGQLGQLDARTDLWAAGATLFTLLTGQYVHPGRTTTHVLEAAREREAPAVLEQGCSVPQELAAVIDRALAFEPDERFQAAADMRAACEVCASSLAVRGERSRFFASAAPTSRSSARGMSERPARAHAVPAMADSAVVSVAGVDPRAGYWSGRVGRLWWFHYTGPCTDETWRQYLGHVQQMLDSGRPSTLACLAHHADAPSAVQRKQLADFIDGNRSALERLDRFALVIDSMIHRGAITAIGWLVRKPFEERIFNSPLAALKWLTENHPELDAETVRASIAAQVPRHSLWTALGTEAEETVEKSAQR
jgi:Protein kinase domain